MIWKTFITTFGLIFLAELGDKTQLATMLMATQSKDLWSVFLGAALALVFSAFLGVLLGATLTRHIPTHYLQGGAGIAFILIGILLICGKF